MATDSTPGPPYTITGLTPSTQYDVKVRAVNAAGASAWTTAQRITTSTSTSAPPPTGRATKIDATTMSGPYYTPIPASPVLDSNSSTKSATLAGLDHYAGLGWTTVCFTVPSDPSYTIVYGQDPLTQPGQTYDWVDGPWAYAEEYEPIRIPDPPNFHPMGGGYADGREWDGWGCVVDTSRGIGWAGWRMVKNGANWQATTSHAFDTATLTNVLAGGGRGDGLSVAAGTITVQEVAAAMADATDSYVIPHALAGSIPSAKTDSNVRAPATKTDGIVAPTSSTISEGSRFFLPASATTSSSGRLIKTLVRTLKAYGIYIVDRNGSTALMTNFEHFDPANPDNMVTQNSGAPSNLANTSAISAVYYDAGLTFDYANLSAVPWGSLQLLANWQGN